MEVEKSPTKLAKKLWKVVRIVLYMMRKGIANGNNLMLDLPMLLKKVKLSSKAILDNIAMLPSHHNHHCYSSLICRSNDISSSFISPQEYEFSCSNTPVNTSRHRNLHHRRLEELKLIYKVKDILNRIDIADASPQSGFIHTPMMKDQTFEGRHQVDNDAEEFINKFYLDLKNQRRIAAMDSPSPKHICARDAMNESLDSPSVRDMDLLAIISNHEMCK